MVNILLIDQEPLFQQAFSKMITETEDCQLVGIAENSKEAFEIISRYHPQVIFCDVVLGMENGIQNEAFRTSKETEWSWAE